MNKRILLAIVLLTSFAGKMFASEEATQALKSATEALEKVSEALVSQKTQQPFYTRAYTYASGKGSAALKALAALPTKTGEFCGSLATKAGSCLPSKEVATTFVADHKYALAVVGVVAVTATAYAGYRCCAAKRAEKAN